MSNNLKSLGKFKDFKDGSIKSVFQIDNNKIIEMTLLFNREKRDVICVPTHHFCNLGCKMCHLTNKGLNKCMQPINANDFFDALIKSLTDNNGIRRTNKKQLLISFMGVGEPLMNIELIKSINKRKQELKDLLGYNEIAYAISTMMPSEELFNNFTQMILENEIPCKVHFSLHNPIDEKRKDLIPATKINVDRALELLIEYRDLLQLNTNIMNIYKKFHSDTIPVEIHYTLIKDTNDSQIELQELSRLLQKIKIPIKFILFNPTSNLFRSENLEFWLKELNGNIPNLKIRTYAPPGKEVGSSCGEFTKHYYHEEIETKKDKEDFLQWKQKHEIFD